MICTKLRIKNHLCYILMVNKYIDRNWELQNTAVK